MVSVLQDVLRDGDIMMPAQTTDLSDPKYWGAPSVMPDMVTTVRAGVDDDGYGDQGEADDYDMPFGERFLDEHANVVHAVTLNGARILAFPHSGTRACRTRLLSMEGCAMNGHIAVMLTAADRLRADRQSMRTGEEERRDVIDE